jgi:hypothetical protein
MNAFVSMRMDVLVSIDFANGFSCCNVNGCVCFRAPFTFMCDGAACVFASLKLQQSHITLRLVQSQS